MNESRSGKCARNTNIALFNAVLTMAAYFDTGKEICSKSLQDLSLAVIVDIASCRERDHGTPMK